MSTAGSVESMAEYGSPEHCQKPFQVYCKYIASEHIGCGLKTKKANKEK